MDKRDAIKRIQASVSLLMNELDEVMSPLFISDWGKRAALGVLVLSGCISLYMVISVINDWRHNVTVLRAASVQSNVFENNMAEWVARIPQQHLFGEYGVVDKSTILPITSLQLDLKGIIKATSDGQSRVILSEGGKLGKVYQIGDTLESGVRIHAITDDGVVLENGGQFEKLPLRRIPLDFQAKFKPSIPKNPSVTDSKIETPPPPTRPEDTFDEDEER